jgi:RHS repeat-associated protein
MRWDFKNQLHETVRQVVNGQSSERTYYVYDSTGERVRKVTVTASGRKKHERIYISGFEVYREYDHSGAVILERETLHIMDDKQRVALVETKALSKNAACSPLTRYQFGNHLGSAVLELDDHARIISYEEYFPYGSTSYQAVRRGIEGSPKRYRYSGKERDHETALYYHGARYYAPWLGRWTSCDPKVPHDAVNLYVYGINNPLRFIDPDGMTDLVAGLLSKAQESYSRVKIQIKADIGDVAQYVKQGVARYADELSQTGRLTEAEHPIAGAAAKLLNPAYVYRQAKTIVIDRAVAVAKTAGDLRLIKAVKSGAMGAEELAERSKANFVKAVATRWAQTGEPTVAKMIKGARQAAAAAEESAKEALPTLSRSGATRSGQQGFAELGLMRGIASSGLAAFTGLLSYKELKQDIKEHDYGRALASGSGVAASGTTLFANASAMVTGVSTSSIGLGTSVGGMGAADAIAAAPHVVGAFALGAGIGVGIQEGSAYVSKKYLGREISPGQMIGDTLTAEDKLASKLWVDPSKPAYTQTLGWKISSWLTPTSH